jgi:hypothetical protein
MNTLSKTPAPSAGAIRVPLSKIHGGDALRARTASLSEHHVHELRQAIRRGSKLPPLLVWEETEEDGLPTGRLVLVDGGHRLAALRSEKPDLAHVLAEVLQCARQEAFLAGVSRNTRAALPLTRWEATNAAWKAVMLDPEPYTLSKSQLARDCAVSPRTVATMRARWKAWPADGSEPTGDWQRDKRDSHGGEAEVIDVEDFLREREEKIDQTAKAIRKAVGPLPEHDVECFSEAVARVLGHRLPSLLDYLGSEDGELPWTGLPGDEDPNEEPPF